MSILKKCLVLMVLVTLATGTAQAAKIVVNITSDELTGSNGSCSLREAIQVTNANSNAAYPECELVDAAVPFGADEIELAAGTYLLTLTGAGSEDANASGDLDISDTVAITGEIGTSIVDGSGISGERVFHILANDDNVSFYGLTVQGGSLYTETADAYGAGIYAELAASFSISQCFIYTNTIFLSSGSSYNANGAGIAVQSSVDSFSLSSSYVSLNLASDLNTSASSIVYGVGLFSASPDTVIFDTEISDNETDTSGQVHGVGVALRRLSGSGLNGTILNSVIKNNSAVSETTTTSDVFGGGVYTNDFNLAITDSAILSNSIRLTQSSANVYGGGLAFYDGEGDNTLSVVNATFAHNSMANDDGQVYGGGISLYNTNSADFSYVTIAYNTAGDSSTSIGYGGGIYNYNNLGSAVVTFKSSILAENDIEAATPAGRNCNNNAAFSQYLSSGFNVIGNADGALSDSCYFDTNANDLVLDNETGIFASETVSQRVLRIAEASPARDIENIGPGDDCQDIYGNSVSYDQRGVLYARNDEYCDAGATEYVPFYYDKDADDFSGEYDEYDGTAAVGSQSGDCDDGDSEISPSATESCDGIDNNCDGVTDEYYASGATSYYLDSDNDGYGSSDPADILPACSQPFGYSSTNDDCDDTNDAASPGEAESCDDVDNDCDGDIDENNALGSTAYYPDTDGDGHGSGDAATTVNACSAISGYATVNDDCDDASAAVSPSATEICDNGIDDDCSDSTDENNLTLCPAVCGDGVVEGAEECDGESNCTDACALVTNTGGGNGNPNDTPTTVASGGCQLQGTPIDGLPIAMTTLLALIFGLTAGLRVWRGRTVR